jgi:hypothetical protein
VYDAVLHHVESYYNTHPDEAKKAGCIAIDKGVYALSLKQKQQILLDNIYGVDIDPQAVEVAQLSLFLKFLESESGAGASQLSFERTKILPDLSKNIVCGNSLVEYDIADLFPLTDAEEKRIKPFSFNSAFREVMQRGGFDAIVGNPPYGASFEPNVQKYLRKKYETASSTTDSYVLFIENASKQLCRNGMVGMIVQSGWVSAPSGRALRSYFAKALSPTDFVTLPYDVFGAYIDTIIFTAKKKEIAEEWPNSVRLVRFPVKHKIVNLTDFSAFTKIANPRTWLSSTNQEYLIGLSNAEQSIIQKVSENSKRLNTIADIQRGVTPFQLTPVKPKLNPYRAFNGTVRRYTITEDAPMFIRYDESLAEYKPARYFVGPRLLIREMISRQFRIQACFVEESFITNKSMQSVLLVDKNYDIHFVLGVLNSALISWYFLSVNSVGMRDDFPKIVLKQTRELPLPIIDPNDRKMMSQQNKVAGLASQMLSTKKQLAATSRDSDRERLRSKCDYLDVEIDKLVYQLYGLTAEEIRIIEAPAKGE